MKMDQELDPKAKLTPYGLITDLWQIAISKENEIRRDDLARLCVHENKVKESDCEVTFELAMLVEGLNITYNRLERCNIYFDLSKIPKIGKLHGHSGLLTEYVIYPISLLGKLQLLQSMPTIQFDPIKYPADTNDLRYKIIDSILKETALLMVAGMMLRQRYRATHTNEMHKFDLCLGSQENIEKITDPRFRIVVENAINYNRLLELEIRDFDAFVIARWIASLCQNPFGVSANEIISAIWLSPADVGIK